MKVKTIVTGTVTINKVTPDYQAKLAERTLNVGTGHITVLSKSLIKNPNSQWDKKNLTIVKHSKHDIPLIQNEALLCGTYKQYYDGLSDKSKALPMLVDVDGNEAKAEGFFNPELPVKIEGGVLSISL